MIAQWEREKHDLLGQAECVSELKLLSAENPQFAAVDWIRDGFLRQVPNVTTATSAAARDELKQALLSLSVPGVNNSLKAMAHLFDADGCAREVRVLMDAAVQAVDMHFLNLQAARGPDAVSRQLPRIGNALHTYLEQFQLLGESATCRVSKSHT